MIDRIIKIKTALPPLGPALVHRSRAVEQLERDLHAPGGFSRRLTLVSAPAGFGKTTLVQDWLAGRKDRVAWLSLDSADNDPQRFWTYLIAALQKIHNVLGKGTLAMLHSPPLIQDSPTRNESLLTPLLNELLDLGAPAYLVLDDYHFVTDPGIHESMAFFIGNMPPSLHLVVTARADPPWPISRWRAKKRLLEIRQPELRFSEEEAELLLAGSLTVQLKPSDMRALYHKTEGWVTGLQLAAYTLSRHPGSGVSIESFTGSDRRVFQFLSEEVLARQSLEVREFLHKTSILNRFCASLCDAVTGRNDSHDLLARLVNDNLFIVPLDDSGTWYRYHHLFEELLLDQLRNSSPGKVSGLYQRAGCWFLEAGEPGEAVRYFFQGEAPGRAAQVLHDHMESLWQTEGYGQLIRWFTGLPGALMKRYPRLLAYRGVFLLIDSGIEETCNCLQLAEGLAYEDNDEQAEFTGMLAVVRAYDSVLNGDFFEALEYAERALQQLPPSASLWRILAAIAYGDAKTFCGDMDGANAAFRQAYRDSKKRGDHLLTLSAGLNMVKIMWARGKLREGGELIAELLRFAREERLSGIPRLGGAWVLLGEILREKGELAEAERCLERGISLSRFEKQMAVGFGNYFLSVLTFSKREYARALQLIERTETFIYETELPAIATYLASTWKARVLLEMGELSRAREALSNAGVAEDSPCFLLLENGHLVLAQAALMENETDRARRILDRIEKLPFYEERKGLVIETLLLKARLEELSGNPRAAEERLKAALATGKAAGFYQVFLDRGRELDSVFCRVITVMDEGALGAGDGELLEYARVICRRLSGKRGAVKGKGDRPRPGSGSDRETDFSRELVEKLTPREIEILGLISRGYSNRDISGKLYLSVGTVKWHTVNIYGKLGVRSRTRAVARARELNILPSKER